MTYPLNRRHFLNTSVTAVGMAGLAAASGVSAGAVASPDEPAATDVRPAGDRDSVGAMPCGTIGKLKISRMILGSNLMGGYAHSRDLQYVGALMRAYNTEEKILDTLALAESVGINTVSQGDMQLIQKYNDERGGHMQQLGPLNIREEDSDDKIRTGIKQIVDQGSAAIYIFGHDGDLMVRAGRVDVIAKAIDWIRQEGLPAGVGGHSLHVVRECEEHQVNPDFYFKTFHHDRYWSATLKEHRDEYCWYQGASSESGHYHDNMWCVDPEGTIEVMRDVKAAWIAFKVLAAGAIHPKIGFSYALRNGADFMVVGMFDFQVQQNADLIKDQLRALDKRDRPWRA
ncbi:MAG: hypothetical protein ACYC4U_30915 [Pirellulaceae bacterium]